MNAILKNTLEDYPPLVPFEINVPKLTILTGENGAGKSRLLSQIKAGKIAYKLINEEILKAHDIHLVKEIGYSFQGKAPDQITFSDLCTIYHFKMHPLQNEMSTWLKSQGVTHNVRDLQKTQELELFNKIVKLVATQMNDEKIKTLSCEEKTIHNRINEFIKHIEEKRGPTDNKSLVKLALRQYFPRVADPLYLAIDNPTSFNLAQLFQTWAKIYAANQFECYLKEKGVSQAAPLDDDEFKAIYGPKPWEVLNKTLKDMRTDLQFFVDDAYLFRQNIEYKSLILSNSNGVKFSASTISSGEKVIFQMAMSQFIKEADSINYLRPKLILFDEPDAHLHPSLANQMLKTLKEQFVDQGINVIITTHSPTTVGLAEEGSIIFMRSGQKPEKVSRRSAVNKLLSGQEKLFIDLSGSYIIFVEDSNDVTKLDVLCSALDLPSNGQKLIFRSISQRTPKGSEDGGKGRVKKLIKAIGEQKNIAGLIDYDGKERSGEGVFVLAEGERYGIENILLDPRIIIYFLVTRDLPNTKTVFKLEIANPNEFDLILTEDMQRCIDQIERRVFASESTKKETITYEDGKTYKISKQWLMHNGHDLAQKVIKEYRLNNKINTASESATDEIVLEFICTHIIADNPGILPGCFRTSIEKLCSYSNGL